MSENLSQILAAIAGLGTQFGGQLARVDERLSRVDERLERLEKLHHGLQDEVTKLRVDMMSRLDRQQDTLARLRDDVTVETAAVDNTREKFTQIRNDYDQLAHQVSVVHRRLMALESRLDSRDGA